MEYDRAQKFGREPSPNELVLSLKELSLKNLKDIPFPVLNELLKTRFPAKSNGESHKLLFDAIQKTVTSPKMKTPLELVLRSDGLMIRICSSENATLYQKAINLAAKFHLSENRISHSLCPECEQKERARYKIIQQKRKQTKKSVIDLALPASEVPAIALED